MRLRRALDEFVVDGIETTLPLFRTLVRNPTSQNGDYDIHWLGEVPGADSRRDRRPASRRRSGEHRGALGQYSVAMASRDEPPSRSRRRCCCAPMPAASFRWRRAPRTRRSTGSSRRCAASFRSTASTSPHGSRARCAPTRFDDHASTRDFDAVIDGCAAPRPGRDDDLDQRAHPHLYRELHRARALPHAWRSGGDGELVGGLYGVALGGAFFGESMFHRARDASKVALVHLVARLIAAASSCSTRNSSPSTCAASARSRVPRPQYTALLEKALRPAKPIRGVPTDRPVTGGRKHWRWWPTCRARGLVAEEAATRVVRRKWRNGGAGMRRGGVRSSAAAAASAEAARCGGRRRSLSGRRRRGRGRDLTVRQPDVIDRMLDTVQARAGGKHPAGEDALDLALQRHFVDLDKGVGVRRFGRRAGVARTWRHLQRAELHGLADRDVEIDDAAGNLVESRKSAPLVDDLLRRRFGDHFVAGLERGGPLCYVRAGDTLGLALPRQRERRRAVRPRHPGLAAAARSRCLVRYFAGRRWRRVAAPAAATAPTPAAARPAPAADGSGARQQAAPRQLRNFLVIVELLLIPAWNSPGRARRRIGKNIAYLRARGRRKRDRRGGYEGRETGQGNGSKHLAALAGEFGARDIVQTYPPLAGSPVNTGNTAGKGRFAPCPPTGQPPPQMK